MNKIFKRNIGSLDEIFDFIAEFLTAYRINDQVSFQLKLIVEELFTNTIKYQPSSKKDISIGLEKADNRIIIRIVDSDVEPFDITRTAGVDVNKPLGEKRAGGLGIHLVKYLVDNIDYTYKDRQSTITLTKILEQKDV